LISIFSIFCDVSHNQGNAAPGRGTSPDFLEELLQKRREAIADADPDAVMGAAHSIKGELGYLGAAQATQAARELEDMRYGAKPRHWSVWVETRTSCGVAQLSRRDSLRTQAGSPI